MTRRRRSISISRLLNPAREHRRIGRLAHHNLRLRSLLRKHTRDTLQRPSRTKPRNPIIQSLTLEIVHDLPSRRPRVHIRIRFIRKLTRQKPSMRLGQLHRLGHHSHPSRSRGSQHNLRPQEPHQLAPFHAESLRHRHNKRIPLLRAHHRQPDPRIPTRSLDHRLSGLQLSSLFSILNHTKRQTIFHRPQRIERLYFDIKIHMLRSQPIDLNHRSPADCLENIGISSHVTAPLGAPWRPTSFTTIQPVQDNAFLNPSELTPKTIQRVIVHNPRRLHPRIHNNRPNKFESPLLQRLRHLLRKRSLRRNNASHVLDRLTTRQSPDKLRKILAIIPHLQINASPANRSLNLRPGPNNPRILQQPFHFPLTHPSHGLRIELMKRLTKRVTLAQNCDPRQPRLEPLQHEHLPQSAAVMLRDSPLLVVVRLHQRIILRPRTAMNLLHSQPHRPIVTEPAPQASSASAPPPQEPPPSPRTSHPSMHPAGSS